MKDDDDEPSASQLLTAGPSPRWAHTYWGYCRSKSGRLGMID
jgi:hypothetical protein